MDTFFVLGCLRMETYGPPNVSIVSSKGGLPPTLQPIADVQVILPATSEGFLNPPPPAREYKDYVYRPNSQYPKGFGKRCAFLCENGLRV